MKPTKEEITQIGMKVAQDVYKEEYNEQTATVEKSKVKVYTTSKYYQHDGWVFQVDSVKKYIDEYETIFLFLLDDGTPLHMWSILGDDNPRTIYSVKDTNGDYIPISMENFLKYHQFDFSKFEEKKYREI